MMKFAIILATIAVCTIAVETGVKTGAGGTDMSSSLKGVVQLTDKNNRVFTAFGSDGVWRATRISRNETWLVYSTDPDTTHVCPNVLAPLTRTCFPRLYSVKVSASDAVKNPKETFSLSPATMPDTGDGVTPEFKISPEEKYVIFGGQVATANTFSVHSNRIGGTPEDIRLVSPTPAPNSAKLATPLSTLVFRPKTMPKYPYPFYEEGDSQVLFSAPTLVGTTANPAIPTDAKEFYVNDVYPDKEGKKLKRLLPSLGTEGNNKVTNLVFYNKDWIIFQANNGSSTVLPSTDINTIYMSNWEATKLYSLSQPGGASRATNLISCSPGQINQERSSAGSSFWSSTTCDTLFSPDFKFIAVRDFQESITYKSLRIFDMNKRALIRAGAAISPPQLLTGGGVQRVLWSWDSKYVFFTVRPASLSTQTHLYVFKPDESTLEAVRISPDGGDGSAVGTSVFAVKNPAVIVFTFTKATVNPVTSQTNLYAYNFASKTPVLRQLNPALITLGAVSTVGILPSVTASNPYVVFNARVTDVTSNLYNYKLTADLAPEVVAAQLNPTLVPTGAVPETATQVSWITNDDHPEGVGYGKASGKAWIVYQAASPITFPRNLFCVAHDAISNVDVKNQRITPDFDTTVGAGGQAEVITARDDHPYIYKPGINSSAAPTVYYAGKPTGVSIPTQYYYVANCGTGAISQLSRGSSQPVSGKVLGPLKVSPDKKWAVFSSPNGGDGSKQNLFGIPADGNVDPVLLTPTVTGEQTTTNDYMWAKDSSNVISIRSDLASASRRRILTTPIQSPLDAAKVIDLTPKWEAYPNLDPIASVTLARTTSPSAVAQGPTRMSEGDNALTYTMRWPDIVNSSNALYAISPAGGTTVAYTWNTTLPSLAGSYALSIKSQRVVFFGDKDGPTVGGASSGDVYRNQIGSGSLLVPAFLLLSFVLALFA